jgi:hypothetical protein
MDDKAWMERALAAWRYSAANITTIGQVPNFRAVFFDGNCVQESANALNATKEQEEVWSAAKHPGAIKLPDGQQVPIGPISFAHNVGKGGAFFVMAVPSVWRKAGIDNAAIGLETMLVAVLLHEASHVSQNSTYGARMTALTQRNHLPESFNDDSIQQRFKKNADFSASVDHETSLFFAAAAAPDRRDVVRLAKQARALMRARMARYFVGKDAYMAEAEDIWLTMEGSAQWAGYQWIIDPKGGAKPVPVALADFAKGGGWWTQQEGLALFLVLDRLLGRTWREHAFHDGRQTVLQMLDKALAENLTR